MLTYILDARCPVCAAAIDRGFFVRRSFRCQHCNASLEVGLEDLWPKLFWVDLIASIAVVIFGLDVLAFALIAATVSSLVIYLGVCRRGPLRPKAMPKKQSTNQ